MFDRRPSVRLLTFVIASPALTLALACTTPAPTPAPRPTAATVPTLPTRAERTRYTETSTDSDVHVFLSELNRRTGRTDFAGLTDTALGAASINVSAYDSSTNGGFIPIVIASRPRAMTAQDAHGHHRPVVFIEAGAGGDDGAGVDALLATIRDLLTADTTKPNALDSILLVAVPLANPEAVVPGMSSKNLTIISPIAAPDTDLVAITARETRTTLAILHGWHPDVIIDLRTADAGGAAYPLTLAPTLTPAALLTRAYTADTLLPELRLSLAALDHLETFRCGTIIPPWMPRADTTGRVFEGCDYRTRALTNYAGLINRVGLLARTNATDSLATQVRAARAFIERALSTIAAHGSTIVARSSAADSTLQSWGANPETSPDIPIRATRDSVAARVPILVDESAHTPDSARHDPGAIRRTHTLPVRDHIGATRTARLPVGYILDPHDSATVRLLQRHGIDIQRHVGTLSAMIVERFVIDSAIVDTSHPDADHPPHIAGHWLRSIGRTILPPGTVIVRCDQPLGLLAAILLEPESDDGLVAWRQFDATLRPGATFPIAKLIQ